MRPRVLVFIDWYLPGYKAGGPVRSLANLVDHLRHRIDFHIVTTDRDYTATERYPGTVSDTWVERAAGEYVWYASRKAISRATWLALLARGPWDAVYINGIYSRWFSIEPLWLLRGSAQRRVVAVRGMLAEGPMRHGALKKRLFLLTARLLGLYRGVVFQATNPEEAQDIRRWIATDATVHVVPNLPRHAGASPPAAPPKRPGELRLVSVARIAVEKNTLFAIEQLRTLRGQVRLDLYGPIYDEGYWVRCREAIAALPASVEVVHHGPVHPDRVPALLATHHALLMPSAGENFGHTLLEALCAGLPLVVSDRTPWRDLAAQHAGWDLPLERPSAFTEALQALVDMDAEALAPWRAGAFALGRRYLDDPDREEAAFRLLIP